MKIDSSSYYPKSPLDDMAENDRDSRENRVISSLFPESEKREDTEDMGVKPDDNGGKSVLSESDPGEVVSERNKGIGPATGKVNDSDKTPRYDSKDADPLKPVDIFSTFLSWILVPLLMPVYGMLLIFSLSVLRFNPFPSKAVLTGLVFCFNVLLPMLLILLLKKLGYVKDVGLNNRDERFIPYLITIICMGGTAVFMNYRGAPFWLAMFFAGGALAALINLLINFRWKISAHAAGIAGVVALLLHLVKYETYCPPSALYWLIIFILLSGLLGSSRIWLGRHTVLQVLAGYVVGFCSVYFLTMIS